MFWTSKCRNKNISSYYIEYCSAIAQGGGRTEDDRSGSVEADITYNQCMV